MRFIFLALFALYFLSTASAFRKFFLGKQDGGALMPIKAKPSLRTSSDYFTQKLDHFNPTDNSTWQQVYFVNDAQYKPENKAAFLFIGGEGEASISWMSYGAWYDSAKKYGALMFQLEHRFYGNSHPTEDLSLENLKYLTSTQAMADLANFIVAMNEKYKLPEDVNWIVFGGSYAGSLAAWSRVLYPHLIKGAMSASGPLLAELDFLEYFKVVGNSIGTYSQQCVDNIKTGIQQVDDMVNQGGIDNITSLFNLCENTYFDNPLDTASFYQMIADGFAGVVQYNLLSSPSIDEVCDIINQEGLGEPVDRLAGVTKLIYGEGCLETSYNASVDSLRETSFNNGGMWRQWFYQTCTEFGFFQTSTYEQHIFGDSFPIDFFVQMCEEVFGKEYDEEYLKNAIAHTNMLYGGKNIKASNVVYVHGTIDPWSALGVTETIDEIAPAIFVEGAAHCANMYPPRGNDPPGLDDARTKVNELIGEWLGLK